MGNSHTSDRRGAHGHEAYKTSEVDIDRGALIVYYPSV